MKNIYKNVYLKPFVFSFILFPLSFIFFVSIVGCSKTPTSPTENRPQVEIKGPITEDTIWESRKDYIVEGVVTVEQDATLTIKKDVHVYFNLDELGNKGKLEVRGGIYADGKDSTTMIFFQPGNVDTGGEEGWGVELFEGKSSSVFKYCSFKDCIYGIKTIKTRLIVSKCSFEYCHYGINISRCDSVFVLDSTFSQNVNGVLMELSTGLTDSCIVVSRNRFFNCTNIAVEVKDRCKGILITDNYFEECSTGFLCAYSSRSKLIHSNFKDCILGTKYMNYSGGEIKRNIFIGSKYSIVLFILSYPVIQMNNLLECDSYKIYINQYRVSDITNAEHNWWGTNQKDKIEMYIFDANDTMADSTWGIVDFEPFQTSIIDDCGVRGNKF